MKSPIVQLTAAIAALWLSTTSVAQANLVPEPSSLPLVGIAIAAAAYFLIRRK